MYISSRVARSIQVDVYARELANYVIDRVLCEWGLQTETYKIITIFALSLIRSSLMHIAYLLYQGVKVQAP